MADPESPARPDPETPRGVDLWLAPFFRDSSLWPVLAVAIAIFVVLGAWALLLAFVERNLPALGALLLLFWMSVDALIRNRRGSRSRLLVGCVAGFWLASTAAALGARWAGWY